VKYNIALLFKSNEESKLIVASQKPLDANKATAPTADFFSFRTLNNHLTNAKGKVGWAVLWLLGVPLPILFLLYLLRGCT
jgi:hypothetical protein